MSLKSVSNFSSGKRFEKFFRNKMGNSAGSGGLSETEVNTVRAHLREGKIKYKGMKKVLMSATHLEGFQDKFLREMKNTLLHILIGSGYVIPEQEREASLIVLFSELRKEVLSRWQIGKIEKIPGVEKKELGAIGIETGPSISLVDLK